MTNSPVRSTTTTLMIALLLAACSSATKDGVRTTPGPASAGGQTAAPAKPKTGRYPYTEADVQFMRHMIDHHAQALAMAGWAPTHGASSSLRILAERIINGQQDEIATMQRWLRDRGHSAPEPGDSSMRMHQHPSPSSGQAPSNDAGHAHMLMPGMLTDAQMKELDRARGRDFDRLFLTYMIQHHKGAVTMVNDLFGTPGAARDESVFKLASDVSADQTSEITRMERMLSETR